MINSLKLHIQCYWIYFIVLKRVKQSMNIKLTIQIVYLNIIFFLNKKTKSVNWIVIWWEWDKIRFEKNLFSTCSECRGMLTSLFINSSSVSYSFFSSYFPVFLFSCYVQRKKNLWIFNSIPPHQVNIPLDISPFFL